MISLNQIRRDQKEFNSWTPSEEEHEEFKEMMREQIKNSKWNEHIQKTTKEVATMEEKKTANPQIGEWEKLNTEEIERKPSIDFEINKPQVVSFSEEFLHPREYPNHERNGVFYVFDVIHEGIEKSISTSAWTLLKGLKQNEPLAGKTLEITKEIEKGKQFFTVKEKTNDPKLVKTVQT